MQDPILITGCARSGTSLIAGIFHMAGAWGGNVTGPTPYNRKGQFENNYIRDRVVKPYLKSIGADPLGQNPLPSTTDMIVPIGWNELIEDVIFKEGYVDGPWYYKGAKMCLMWPVWHVAYPKARWIVVRRPDQDIINSCLRTPFMRAYKNVEGWGKWVDHHKRCFEEMKSSGLKVMEIWSDMIVGGNYFGLEQAITACRLDFDKKAVQNFIDPELYHSN